MRLQLTPVEQLPMYCQGLGPGGRFGAVAQTYFPLRHGCRVTLYQNASVATDEEVLLGDTVQLRTALHSSDLPVLAVISSWWLPSCCTDCCNHEPRRITSVKKPKLTRCY